MENSKSTFVSRSLLANISRQGLVLSILTLVMSVILIEGCTRPPRRRFAKRPKSIMQVRSERDSKQTSLPKKPRARINADLDLPPKQHSIENLSSVVKGSSWNSVLSVEEGEIYSLDKNTSRYQAPPRSISNPPEPSPQSEEMDEEEPEEYEEVEEVVEYDEEEEDEEEDDDEDVEEEYEDEVIEAEEEEEDLESSEIETEEPADEEIEESDEEDESEEDIFEEEGDSEDGEDEAEDSDIEEDEEEDYENEDSEAEDPDDEDSENSEEEDLEEDLEEEDLEEEDFEEDDSDDDTDDTDDEDVEEEDFDDRTSSGDTSGKKPVMDVLKRAVGIGKSPDIVPPAPPMPPPKNPDSVAAKSKSSLGGGTSKNKKLEDAFEEIRRVDKAKLDQAKVRLGNAKKLLGAGNIDGARSEALIAGQMHPEIAEAVETFLFLLSREEEKSEEP